MLRYFSAFHILLVDIGTGCRFLRFLRLLYVALLCINGTRTHCCQYFIANTRNWTRTLTCNNIITHVQANNRITALQLQHYQRQTLSLYSPCQCFRGPMHLMSASWFVSDLSCQGVDCQRVGLSARCLSPYAWSLVYFRIFLTGAE